MYRLRIASIVVWVKWRQWRVRQRAFAPLRRLNRWEWICPQDHSEKSIAPVRMLGRMS